jgi:hypothetical protein
MVSEKTMEKVRDASRLQDDLFEDNFCMAELNDAIDGMLPQDVDAEFEAEQLVIDCLDVGKSSLLAKPTRM